MIAKPLSTATAEAIRAAIAYDPHSGSLTWLVDSGRARAGKEAGFSDERGSRSVIIAGRRLKAHRVAWLLTYGEWPDLEVDHIDGDPSNNRLSNLRLANHTQNLGNMKRRRDNATGFKGVHYHKAARRYCAQVCAGKVRHYLGLFDTPQEAHAAYIAAAERLFGEFARAA
jgi:hypothetical protein